MEITTEERARIIATHLPCSLWDIRNKIRVDAYGVDFKKRIVYFTVADIREECYDDINNFQLILKPLSQITDEEAKRVAIIIGCGICEAEKGAELIPHFKYLMSHGQYRVTGRQIQQAIDYLRTIGIDMGYGSIPSLISANIEYWHETV